MKYGQLVGFMQAIDLVAKHHGLDNQQIANLDIKEIVNGNAVEDINMSLEFGLVNDKPAIISEFKKGSIIVNRS